MNNSDFLLQNFPYGDKIVSGLHFYDVDKSAYFGLYIMCNVLIISQLAIV